MKKITYQIQNMNLGIFNFVVARNGLLTVVMIAETLFKIESGKEIYVDVRPKCPKVQLTKSAENSISQFLCIYTKTMNEQKSLTS